MNSLQVKVSDSLDNVPNENVVTTGDQQTDIQTDQLHELLEWLFATKKEEVRLELETTTENE